MDTAAEISASDAASTLGATSSRVTSEPNALKTVTSCAPVFPAPMMPTLRGSVGSSSTCSGTVASSAPGIGRRREWPPTAMITDSAVMRRPLSSWRVVASTNLALPSRMSSTPDAAKRPDSSLSERTWSTVARTRATVAPHCTSGVPITMPYLWATRTSRTSLAAFASTRVGTQPVLTQVPPVRDASTTATRAPSSAALRAADVPAGPAPITTRS